MRIKINFRWYHIRILIQKQMELKYPFAFKVMKHSQAAMYLNGLYSKLAREFHITHKVRLYKNKLTKQTIKQIKDWKGPAILQ